MQHIHHNRYTHINTNTHKHHNTHKYIYKWYLFFQIDSIVSGKKVLLRFELYNRVIIQSEEINFNQMFNLVDRSFF